jgi:CoA:oxalate CoA-transferase
VGILDNIRVLDLGHHIGAPFSAQHLADAGAEVIRIERPGGDDDRRFGYCSPTGESFAFLSRGRNKKGITLDLSHDKGVKILWDLVKVSDVVIEGFAPPELKKRLGVDYPTLSKLNPRVILVSVTAFGLTGPYMNRLGIDPIAQALSGAMSINGFPDSPPVRSAVPWVDLVTGALGALAAVLALYERRESNRGQFIDLALFDVACSAMSMLGVFNEFKLRGIERSKLGNASPYGFGDNFAAQDGLVFIPIVRDSIWRRFAQLMGREDIVEDPRFSSDWTRFEYRDELKQVISEFVATKTVKELEDLFEDNGVPCARVNKIGDVYSNPQVKAREALIEMSFPGLQETVLVNGLTMKFDRTPCEIKRRAPLLGENNEEIYHGLLGYPVEKISQLKEQSVI